MSVHGPLGTRLARLRVLGGGISARDLSALVGVASGHIAMIESGERPAPRSDTLDAIARVTGCSLDWLVRNEGSEPTAERVLAAIAQARACLASSPAA